jgi:signal transduction histidine kinase
LSVGIACAIVGVLVELGLDQVVGVAPWLIVAAGSGIVAAILGGQVGGIAAAVIGFASQAVVVRPALPSLAGLDGDNWQMDLAVAFGSIVIGLWIRALLLRPAVARARAPGSTLTASAAVASRSDGARRLGSGSGSRIAEPAASAGASESDRVLALAADVATSPDRALLVAVRDLGTARTPVQVADALARHAAAVSGARGSIVYLRADGASGFVARGRFGAADPTAPERIAATGAVGPAGAQPDDQVLQLPFGRGPIVAGLIRFVGGLDPAVDASGGPTAGPTADRRAGPLVELLWFVAADSLARITLEVANRSAAREADGAAGRVGVLATLAAELVRATTVDEVCRFLVDLAVDELGAGFALVHVPDQGSGRFRLAHARGYPAGLAASQAVIAAGASGPVTRAATEGAIVEVSGEEGWRQAFPNASNVPAITGVKAITAIPMQAASGLQGVLVIGWRDTLDRAALDRDLLKTAADQGAQAIERAILQAHDEDARRLQEAFIAVVSHELRTPITTILAGSRILRRRLADDPRSAELMDDVEFEADRLSRIVDDLLVLSRLERRHLTLGEEPVHLDHLVQRVVRSEAARWPGHQLAVVAATARHVVRGDETYIEQVLRNLVSNAAKYSPEGSLVEVAIDESDAGEILVRVLDRGAGVAPAEVGDLFSLFYRSPTTAASAAGAGIGLFVSRRLVAEMDGRMWASPRPDGGSEFGFALAPYAIEEGDGDEDAILAETASLPDPVDNGGHARTEAR